MSNFVSAIKAQFVIRGLNFRIWEHPNIKYFIKAVKINRPICVKRKNIMDSQTLGQLVKLCDFEHLGHIFKAVFLVIFFGFMCLPSIAPHSVASFDPSRHLVTGDVIFTKNFDKIIMKWSKTFQTRDKLHFITLPRLHTSILCPYRVLKSVMKTYRPVSQEAWFQYYSVGKWHPLTDTRIKKMLTKLNKKMGLHPHHYTFHSFRRSGGTFAYNVDIPLQDIKHHGSWASDCVWSYIQEDHQRSEKVARAFAKILS